MFFEIKFSIQYTINRQITNTCNYTQNISFSQYNINGFLKDFIYFQTNNIYFMVATESQNFIVIYTIYIIHLTPLLTPSFFSQRLINLHRSSLFVRHFLTLKLASKNQTFIFL